MVSLNFTLVVELILFLLFLWGTNRFILRPTVKTIDEREELVQRNEELTAHDLADAEALEQQYAARLSELYRQTEDRVRAARHAANNARIDRIQQSMRQADAEITRFREELMARVDEQTPEARRLATQVAEEIEAHLERSVRV